MGGAEDALGGVSSEATFAELTFQGKDQMKIPPNMLIG